MTWSASRIRRRRHRRITYTSLSAHHQPNKGVGMGAPRRAGRWIWPAVTVAVWLLVGASTGPLQSKAAEVQQNDNSGFLPSSAESTEVLELNKKFVSTEASPAIVVYARDGGLSEEDKAKI